MARRRQSDLNAWLKLFALLPWPVLIALAIISAYSFRELANDNPIHQIQASDYAAPPVIPMLIHGFSTVLQYVAPAFFTVAAVLSWYPRRRRRRLVSNLSPERLAALSWRDFERMTAGYFEKQGYRVRESKSGADGGVDVYATKNGERFLIQCKHWRANQVGVGIVRELYGLLCATGANGAFVVTSGHFTKPARDFARGRNIDLIDARRILSNLGAAEITEPTQIAQDDPTVCPICESAMSVRIARKGPHAGESFLGCSRYPACRGTRPMPGSTASETRK